MQIAVKSTKVAKTGTNKSGDWELIVVTSEDNTDYTTFDKKAKYLTSGAVIEIEPIIKEGKISFKEFKVISEGTLKPSDETPQKQESIENQTRAYIIADLWKAGLAPEGLQSKLVAFLEKLGKETKPSVKTSADEDFEKLGQPVEKGFIDMAWLQESLKVLRDKKLKAWTESNLLSYMKTTYHVEAKTVIEATAMLDKGAANHFVNMVEETLAIA